MYGLFESTVLLFFFDLALARTSGQSLTMYNLNAAFKVLLFGSIDDYLNFSESATKKIQKGSGIFTPN